MTYMLPALMTGGPLDGETHEIASNMDRVEFDANNVPLTISPIAQDQPVQNLRMLRHVYVRDGNDFLYDGWR